MPHVFNTMGTTVSLSCPKIADGSLELQRVIAIFGEFDDRYSLYKPDSELSAIARGHLSLTAAAAELRQVYARAIGWRNSTGGAFTPHRPDGVIDLNGVVKALAMQAAADALAGFGATDWCLNVGGDVTTAGGQADGRQWTVGITEPTDRASLLCAIELSAKHPAVATSGVAERGEHIWRARDGESRYLQVTVLAERIELADVLATAIIAGGQTTLNGLLRQHRVEVLTVDAEGALTATAGFRAVLAALSTR